MSLDGVDQSEPLEGHGFVVGDRSDWAKRFAIYAKPGPQPEVRLSPMNQERWRSNDFPEGTYQSPVLVLLIKCIVKVGSGLLLALISLAAFRECHLLMKTRHGFDWWHLFGSNEAATWPTQLMQPGPAVQLDRGPDGGGVHPSGARSPPPHKRLTIIVPQSGIVSDPLLAKVYDPGIYHTFPLSVRFLVESCQL